MKPDSATPSMAPYNIQTCRSGGRGSGRSGGMPPFILAIEGFDKAEYSMGGPLVVDLRLTNTSEKSLHIPTVFLDQFHDPFEGEEAIEFGFTISLKDVSGRDHELTGTVVRGSTKVPYTTQSLGPGESIRIQFSGHILIDDSPRAPGTVDGQLFASLLITDGECRMWNVVRSKAVGKVRYNGR